MKHILFSFLLIFPSPPCREGQNTLPSVNPIHQGENTKKSPFHREKRHTCKEFAKSLHSLHFVCKENANKMQTQFFGGKPGEGLNLKEKKLPGEDTDGQRAAEPEETTYL